MKEYFARNGIVCPEVRLPSLALSFTPLYPGEGSLFHQQSYASLSSTPLTSFSLLLQKDANPAEFMIVRPPFTRFSRFLFHRLLTSLFSFKRTSSRDRSRRGGIGVPFGSTRLSTSPPRRRSRNSMRPVLLLLLPSSRTVRDLPCLSGLKS